MVLPNFSFERKLWEKDCKIIAGCDEVGRGSFAGPVVAGCVAFEKDFLQVLPSGSSYPHDHVVINDSKKLTSKQREIAEKWIKKNCLTWGIGEVSVRKINKLGMAKATRIAFRKAISGARKRLGRPIDFLLADAFFISYVPGLPTRRRKGKDGKFLKKVNGRQQAIVKGDTKSISIAAASIIAKVHRDDLMIKIGRRTKYRKYGWVKNKGYGTRQHRDAIKKYGASLYHRKVFVETWMKKITI